MEIFFGWFIFSIIVGLLGSSKSIGGIASFFISIFLSPLIGLIVVIVSKNKDTIKFEKQTLLNQQKQLNAVKKVSIPDELLKLSKLKEDGSITEEEYNQLKGNILSGSPVSKVKPTEEISNDKFSAEIICTECKKSYYVGNSKCPYCKTVNANKVNPYSKVKN